MLFLLRKIRRKLMEKNKFTTYLLYAVGEIFLVVIGILIAVSINNWNVEQGNLHKERLLLSQLHEEMLANKEQFTAQLEQQNRILESTLKLVQFFPLSEEKLKDDSVFATFNEEFPYSFYFYSFNPTQGTINSIINTSSLGIIQNDELRLLITSWNDLLVDYKEEEDYITDWVNNQYEPFLSRYMPNPRYVEMDLSRIPYSYLEGLLTTRINKQQTLLELGEGDNILAMMERMIELTSIN